MNENIDLTKILKDCPMFWKFYSSVYGDVEFLGVLHDYPVPSHERDEELLLPEIKRYKYPIKLMADIGEYCVSREGRHRYSVGECTLFPSKDCRDWSKFTAPWYKKERFDPLDSDFNWRDFNDDEFRIGVSYCIKPEPKYRPFKSKEECWKELQKHQPFGWLKSKKDGRYRSIGELSWSDEFKTVYIAFSTSEALSRCVDSVFDEYTFADGAPFGVME